MRTAAAFGIGLRASALALGVVLAALAGCAKPVEEDLSSRTRRLSIAYSPIALRDAAPAQLQLQAEKACPNGFDRVSAEELPADKPEMLAWLIRCR